jgi:hypothetical protein
VRDGVNVVGERVRSGEQALGFEMVGSFNR